MNIKEKLRNTDRFLYEGAFEYKHTLYLRLFDNKDGSSETHNLGDHFVPPLYLESKTPTEFRSFNELKFLQKKEFNSIKELNKFTYQAKKENINTYGNINRAHWFLNKIFPNPLKANHEFHTLWLDIETESGRMYGKKYKLNIEGETKTLEEWGNYPPIANLLKLKDLEQKHSELTKTLKKGNEWGKAPLDVSSLTKKLKFYEEEIFKLSNTKPIRIYDEELDRKVPLEDSCYFRAPGFPKSEEAKYKITVIQLYSTKLKQFIILGTKKWNGYYESEHGLVRYIHCNSEKDMLNKFAQISNKLNPTAYNSFNGLMFDYPYLVNRMHNLHLDYNILSPIGVVLRNTDYLNKDNKTVKSCDIKGLYLLDTMELVKKYSFLKIPNFSLENVAEAFGLKGKVSSASYETFQGFQDGKGYIFPQKPPEDEDGLKIYKAQVKYRDFPTRENLEELQQVVYDNFIDYSIRDVEVMLEIEEVAKVMNTSKLISYICGCNIDEVMGSLQQWSSYMHNAANKDNIIIPTKQMFGEHDIIYKAGWTSSSPGEIWEWVVSFDFGSLYPNLIRTFNIGADTAFVPKTEREKEIVLILKKKFDYYSFENFGPSGKLQTKYGGDTNDIEEEILYFNKLFNDKDIPKLLEEINCTITPNGCLFKKENMSYSAKAMEENIVGRYKAKYEGIKLAGDLERIKAEMEKRGLKAS